MDVCKPATRHLETLDFDLTLGCGVNCNLRLWDCDVEKCFIMGFAAVE